MAGAGVETGVLLINLGTPEAPTPSAVRRYLAEFLSDSRVLDGSAVGRWLLLHGVILRVRPRRSAAAYAKVWTDEGSPLLVESQKLVRAVATRLGPTCRTLLAMRYGHPSIAAALAELRAARVQRIAVLPLFPQYSAAATASALARVLELLGGDWDVPPITTIGAFYDDPGFLAAVTAVATGPLAAFSPDHVLFSYHGLPERQIRKSDPSGAFCLASNDCCARMQLENAGCYRAQCYATTAALARSLGLPDGSYSTSFQSRLGRTPWIQPFTDVRLPELARSGVRRLAVLCPSFVADCLETLEEIGIRAATQWREVGGEQLLAVPCPNDHPRFAEAVADLVRRSLAD